MKAVQTGTCTDAQDAAMSVHVHTHEHTHVPTEAIIH